MEVFIMFLFLLTAVSVVALCFGTRHNKSVSVSWCDDGVIDEISVSGYSTEDAATIIAAALGSRAGGQEKQSANMASLDTPTT